MRDYDLQETSKLVRAVYFGCAMMAFMHLYLKYVAPPLSYHPFCCHPLPARTIPPHTYATVHPLPGASGPSLNNAQAHRADVTPICRYTQPLFIQALMGAKTLYDAKPVAIHVFGKPAEGDLKRPFKAGGMFGAAADPQTDKAAIDEAEKRVGKKEE